VTPLKSIARSVCIFGIAVLAGCATEEAGLCEAPDEERSWHYRDDTRFSWCASCDNTLSGEALLDWARERGWSDAAAPPTPCFFTSQGSPESSAECRRWVCESEASNDEPVVTTDTPMGQMIERQRARF